MAGQHPVRILQIEDNPVNARLTQRLLEDRPGLEVLVADTGESGVLLAHEQHPQLVLLDLQLPDIPGEEVLRRLKGDADTAAIPVVVVSADGTHGHAIELLDAGASAYLTKPFDVEELLALVDQALEGSLAVRRRALS